jgi:predicted nucleic-acid-binding protein
MMPSCKEPLTVQTFDTNVVVRLLLGDDPHQTALAIQHWQNALQSSGIYLPVVVILETVWVLTRAAKLDKARIVSDLQQLIDMEGVILENEIVVKQAIDYYANASADFGDCLVLESAKYANALPVVTFDRRFSRHAAVLLIQ